MTFLFLDCVLDESFTELEVNVPVDVDVKNENWDLIQVIANHCPFLSSLKFNISKPIASEEMGEAFAQSFLRLKNLTSLTITDLTDDDFCIPFLENLGNSCPKLTHLTIKSKFLFGGDESYAFGYDFIMALVVGKNAQLLPDFSELDMNKAHFHVDLLSPISSSLKHLLLQCVECKSEDYGYLKENE